MDPTRKEIESIFSRVWCQYVRRDYINNCLWNDERAVHVSIGHWVRIMIDPFPSLRIWFEEPVKYNGKNKKVDIVIVKLSENSGGNRIYETIADIEYTELLRCEVKYSGSNREGILSDIEFLLSSQKSNPDILHFFAWIPYTGNKTKVEFKKSDIIGKFANSDVGFLSAEPETPFLWSYIKNGDKIYSFKD